MRVALSVSVEWTPGAISSDVEDRRGKGGCGFGYGGGPRRKAHWNGRADSCESHPPPEPVQHPLEVPRMLRACSVRRTRRDSDYAEVRACAGHMDVYALTVEVAVGPRR